MAKSANGLVDQGPTAGPFAAPLVRAEVGTANMTTWTPNLDYVKGLADEVSERSLFGSLSTTLANQTRDVVEELRLARPVVAAVAELEHADGINGVLIKAIRDALDAYQARYGKVPAWPESRR